MYRTLGETFDLVQKLNLQLCQNPKYHKVPFIERDKIVAHVVEISQIRASEARRGVAEFDIFAKRADPYLQHIKIPPSQLFEIIQSAYYNLKSKPKYKNYAASQLDKIIAGWLDYEPNTVEMYRVAAGNYKRFRPFVPEGAKEVSYRSAEETFMRIFKIYDWYIRTKHGFLDLQRDKKSRRIFTLVMENCLCCKEGL